MAAASGTLWPVGPVTRATSVALEPRVVSPASRLSHAAVFARYHGRGETSSDKSSSPPPPSTGYVHKEHHRPFSPTQKRFSTAFVLPRVVSFLGRTGDHRLRPDVVLTRTDSHLAVVVLCKMVLLEKSKFLEELNILFNTSQASGSVRITMKLLLLGKELKDPKPKIEVPKEKICLIRATYKNKKISTRITANEVNSFQEEYCTLLRNSLSSLKKTKKLKKKVMS